jgi:hypothetical protein
MRLYANSFYSAKSPRLIGVYADAQKNKTQYVLKGPPRSNRHRSCESLFFPPNISISHIIPSIDRNFILIC